MASEDAISQNNLKPLARVVAYSAVGVPPEIMGIGPVPAIQNVLKVSGLTLDDIDLIEVSLFYVFISLGKVRGVIRLSVEVSIISPE